VHADAGAGAGGEVGGGKIMKKIFSLAALIVLTAQVATQAQTQKSLSATMNVYVFPTQGQAANVQSQDEAQCYQWGVQNTGTDPFELAKQAQAQQQQAAQAQGSAVKGAAKGAAGGALIGAIAGDAGTGAAVGATTGAVVGRARRRQAEAQAQSAQKATAQQMDNFKKAFSVCLEAKHYMVKY
jgi:hypothetical protein